MDKTTILYILVQIITWTSTFVMTYIAMTIIDGKLKRRKIQKRKCSVCGKSLKLIADKKYMIQVKSDIVGKTLNYECYDCPKCGCQNIIQAREV